MPRTQDHRASEETTPIGLCLSPRGELRLEASAALTGEECLPRTRAASIERAFGVGLGTGLLHLASAELQSQLGPSLAFGRALARRYLSALRALGDGAGREALEPPAEELAALLDAAPPLVGAEYASAEGLATAWRAMDAAAKAELADFPGSVHEYLQARNPAWHAVGRVTFHLAEQKENRPRRARTLRPTLPADARGLPPAGTPRSKAMGAPRGRKRRASARSAARSSWIWGSGPERSALAPPGHPAGERRSSRSQGCLWRSSSRHRIFGDPICLRL